MRTSDRIPKHIESEAALVGGMLNDWHGDAGVIRAARRANITVADFQDMRIAAVFSAVMSMDAAGLPAELPHVHRWMVDRDLIDAGPDGTAWLVQLSEACPSVATADKYISTVRELSDRRKILDATERVKQQLTGAAPLLDVTSELRRIAGLHSAPTHETTSAESLAGVVDDAIAGRRRVLSWPWPALTSFSRALMPQTVTLLVAGPGATKSLMLLQAAAHWHGDGHRLAILELEDGRAFHLRRALAQRIGNSSLTDDNWCRECPDAAREAITGANDWLTSFGACLHELSPTTQPTMAAVGDWIDDIARLGIRIIAVDPLSIIETQRDQYIHDQRFIARVKRVVEQAGCSLILVMHPRKGATGKTADDIAGGAAFGRLAQTVLWLDAHADPRDVMAVDPMADIRTSVQINRTLHVTKSRNGPGQGRSIGFWFDAASLTLGECGVIVRKPKHNTEDDP